MWVVLLEKCGVWVMSNADDHRIRSQQSVYLFWSGPTPARKIIMSDQDPIPYIPNSRGDEDWEALNVLIGHIYESVLHPENWNETLARITATLCPLSWESAFILWEGYHPPNARFVAATGLAAGVQEIYASVYGGNNLWSQRLMRFRNGAVVDSDEITSRQEVMDSPLFKDFLMPWGINRMMAVMLDKRGHDRLGLILTGPGDRDLSVLKRGLRVLAPHMQRAMRISDRIASLQLAQGAAQTASDQSPFGVISLDADLNILSANARATRFEEIGLITMAQSRFSFTHAGTQQKLNEFARTAPPAGTAFQAKRPDGSEIPVLGARIAPQSTAYIGGVVQGAAIILTIGSGPGETPVVEINRVAQWFGLTPAEARLTVALGEGATLQDYAALRATSLNAVRFLLKNVFRKTGTNSQAQLTAMLARLPVNPDEQ
jgi:DNA-binding CsgD family transcriptional regulator/PAS domain-containing protein